MSALAGMFGKKPATKPVVTMPDENDPAVLAAGAKRVNDMRGAGGRDSTLLSIDQESALRDKEKSYGSSVLGTM